MNLRKITQPILLLLLCEVLLLLLFPGSRIIEPTLTAGGDTPSHFISAVSMSRGPLALFSPVTWVHGSLAGFPLFLHYFPLPFALMGLISKAVSLQVAFKLVTLLAVIPVPAAVYFCLGRLGYGRNTAAIGAVLSLAFLFMTENSMWGGNLCSTLAGEFAFSFSFILYIVFTGKLYADISSDKSPRHWRGCSALEALIVLSHGYPGLQCVTGSAYFILRGGNLTYLLRLHAAAAGFAAFWLVPLLWRIPWNTPYSYSWHFESWAELAPPVLWPAFAGCLILAFSSVRNFFRSGRKLSAFFNQSIDCPELYLFWHFGTALLGFSLAPSLGLVDNRFLPFAQIMLVLLGAAGWGRLLSRLPRPNLWLAGFCAGVFALALTRAEFVDTWIQWNYSGMESKPLWNSFLHVNEYLSGDENSPRVVYEHNHTINEAGSDRAFELLPYYSGRSTLEGLYIQSGLNSPFIYYIQSELTESPSCLFTKYNYSRPNPDRAAAHLRLFNVSQVIAVSDNIANALDFSPDYELAITFPPYRIYRLKESGDSYVEPLRFRPLRIPPEDWRKTQFDWFRKSSLRVPLVVASNDSPGDFWKGLRTYDGDPAAIPEVPILQSPDTEPAAGSPVDEGIRAQAVLGDGKITVTTSRPGHPLWIKVSYHPDWRITEGAGELYLASPAFMILVPKTSTVVLTFDTGEGIYFGGKVLFFLTIVVLILDAVLRKVRFKRMVGYSAAHPPALHPPCTLFSRFRHLLGRHDKIEDKAAAGGFRINARFIAAFALISAIVLGAISTRDHRDPVLLYDLAQARIEKINGGQAPLDPHRFPESPETSKVLDLLDEGITRFSRSSVVDFSMLHMASLMAIRERWDDLRPMLEGFLKDNPDSRIRPEGFAWLGEASLRMGQREHAEIFFRQALSCWPHNYAIKQAGLRLAEITGARALLDSAKDLLASGRYIEAYNIFQALSASQDRQIAREAVISLARCSFFMNRWQEASGLFEKWLADNYDSPEADRVLADLRKCRTIIAQNREWMNGLNPPPASPARPGPIVRFLVWAGGLRPREP